MLQSLKGLFGREGKWTQVWFKGGEGGEVFNGFVFGSKGREGFLMVFKLHGAPPLPPNPPKMERKQNKF